MQLSIIIPVYNRPIEIRELLQSISPQLSETIEIIVVEDGSTISCKDECQPLIDANKLIYITQHNSGPGQARNNGAQNAKGTYLLFLDSDCIIPENFIENLTQKLQSNVLKCWGGPDAAHDSFTSIQKAINYSMTSNLTTGGIRGKKNSVDKFYPRSFNMGIRRDVFLKVGGFSEMRFGEDLDLSMRILESGCSTHLLDDQFVYHKRRNTFKSFFKQVYNSGKARINLNLLHPGSLKLVHTLPSVFTLGVILGMIIIPFFPIIGFLSFTPIIVFYLHAFHETKSIRVALLAVIASYCQLFGYGIGFIDAFLMTYIFKKKIRFSYLKSFYK